MKSIKGISFYRNIIRRQISGISHEKIVGKYKAITFQKNMSRLFHRKCGSRRRRCGITGKDQIYRAGRNEKISEPVSLKWNADLPVLWKDTSAEAGLQEKDPMVVQHLHRAGETGV